MRFVTALRDAACPLVAEIKVRDGAGRPLLGDREVGDVVAAYERGGAACLSVVTGRWFGGERALVADVVARTGLPVLHKDFLTRAADVEASAAAGASAVLLVARLLPSAVLGRLAERSRRLGMTPFVEVTDAREIAAVPEPEACVLAVNNKDIADRERGRADLERSRRLLPALRAAGTPCPVSASGVADPRVAADLVADGFAGVLVGTALLRGDLDPARWCTRFASLLARVPPAPSEFHRDARPSSESRKNVDDNEKGCQA